MMFPNVVAASILLYPAFASAKAGDLSINGFVQKSELPSTGEDWLSLSPDLEFQPNYDDADEDPRVAAILKSARDRLLSSTGTEAEYTMQFLNGDETYYNDYSQFWRLIGLYIDCNAPAGEMSDCDGEDEDNNSADGSIPPCQRYLLWAAYIDVHYDGGGIGEYQFFDRHTKSWNDSSCVAENGRCKKVDCHLKNTDFKLLGFFKEPNYHSWMEQLFKHEGMCIWTYDEYNFMQQDRELWPCGCTMTSTKDEESDDYLYYDTKPMPEGRISLGLYTDDRCSQDYEGELDVADVLDSYVSSEQYKGGDDYGDVHNLAQQLETWNDAFDIYKVCQPCVAYDLNYDPSNGNNEDEHENENGAQKFDCYDDADYTNVNQCMKFRTKTTMLTADFRDLKIASDQGTIVEVEVLGTTYGKGGFGRFGNTQEQFTMGQRKVSKGSKIFFAVSSFVLVAAAFMFYRVKRKDKTSAMEAPLVARTYGVSA